MFGSYATVSWERCKFYTTLEAMSGNGHFQWRSEDRSLEWIAPARTGLRDWHMISWKLAELYIFYMKTNQLLMYTGALSDVQTSVNTAMASGKYVETPPVLSFIASCLRSSSRLCSFIHFNKPSLLSTTRVSYPTILVNRNLTHTGSLEMPSEFPELRRRMWQIPTSTDLFHCLLSCLGI